MDRLIVKDVPRIIQLPKLHSPIAKKDLIIIMEQIIRINANCFNKE